MRALRPGHALVSDIERAYMDWINGNKADCVERLAKMETFDVHRVVARLEETGHSVGSLVVYILHHYGSRA